MKMNLCSKSSVPHFVGSLSSSSTTSTNSSQVQIMMEKVGEDVRSMNKSMNEKMDMLSQMIEKLDTRLGEGNVHVSANDEVQIQLPGFYVNIPGKGKLVFPSLTETLKAAKGVYISKDDYGVIWPRFMNIILEGIKPRLPDSVKLCEGVIEIINQSESKVPPAVAKFGSKYKSENYVSAFLLFLQIKNEGIPVVFLPGSICAVCWILHDNSESILSDKFVGTLVGGLVSNQDDFKIFRGIKEDKPAQVLSSLFNDQLRNCEVDEIKKHPFLVDGETVVSDPLLFSITLMDWLMRLKSEREPRVLNIADLLTPLLVEKLKSFKKNYYLHALASVAVRVIQEEYKARKWEFFSLEEEREFEPGDMKPHFSYIRDVISKIIKFGEETSSWFAIAHLIFGLIEL